MSPSLHCLTSLLSCHLQLYFYIIYPNHLCSPVLTRLTSLLSPALPCLTTMLPCPQRYSSTSASPYLYSPVLTSASPFSFHQLSPATQQCYPVFNATPSSSTSASLYLCSPVLTPASPFSFHLLSSASQLLSFPQRYSFLNVTLSSTLLLPHLPLLCLICICGIIPVLPRSFFHPLSPASHPGYCPHSYTFNPTFPC